MNENYSIQSVYDELKELNILTNQTDFSLLCGRTPMWFSCIKARKQPISSDAVLTLAYKLRRIAKSSLSEVTHDRLLVISDNLIETANNNIRRRIENSDALL